ncbi:MAG: hypothetical protein KJ852_12065 [Gammaproteobacteria bacterium]|nr:hypothetical protein [Gammaproteobacteria bacterium]MBU0813567.1 hypothetical protein [Gammaproteobacteria bacterium]MBU1787685.1 hypothetical protein [Gammaproteobacteria bacterium]
MFKPVVVDAETLKRPQAPMPVDVVNNIFKVFHGFYGNLFLSKFSTGEVDPQGGDAGIISARQIWGHGLRDFDAGTVKAALAQCMDRHPEFPPSLPQFVALCAANKPREVYRPAVPALEMSQGLKSAYSARAREINERHAQRAIDRKTGYVELPQTLDGLKAAIANAVATAGGDEVKELRRLNVMFAPKVVPA